MFLRFGREPSQFFNLPAAFKGLVFLLEKKRVNQHQLINQTVARSEIYFSGKSILAAIDDKEGLRAALAKAIDRVEKVVANKNGALKELAAKKEDGDKTTGACI